MTVRSVIFHPRPVYASKASPRQKARRVVRTRITNVSVNTPRNLRSTKVENPTYPCGLKTAGPCSRSRPATSG